jgi:phage terminase large subunit-like protein
MTGGRSGLIQRAIEQLEGAIRNGDMTHDGSYALTRHVLAARRRLSGGKLQLSKESDYSPNKIDAAVAAVLAWQARLDAVSAGIGTRRTSFAPSRLR